MNTKYLSMILTVALAPMAACGDDDKPSTPKTDTAFRAEVVASMQTSISADLSDLVTAATELKNAAPTHAWNATTDKPAIDAMIAAWKKTRVAYEHVEGATAPIFGDLDGTMDARYDDYMLDLHGAGDPNPFDAEGVTGMHGIERILFAPTIRIEVVESEAMLDGYAPAAFPATDDEALSFKNLLCQKLIDDAKQLHDSWEPAKIDLDFAFDGLVGLMKEQGEKVDLAATGEEESRYANLTMFDLRNNLAGTTKIYGLFRPWIQSKDGGVAADTAVEAKLAALSTVYSNINGEAIPEVPLATWSAETPSAADLATDFGKLWKAVHDAINPDISGSVVFEMQLISDDVLDLKQLPED
jgi:iron uptake system component EfeO